MLRHRVFRFGRSTSWEDACQTVEDWVNAYIPSENVVSVMMEDNEENLGDDVVIVWYREAAGKAVQ